MQLITSPFEPAFRAFVERIDDPCVICSPYVTKEPVDQLVASIARNRLDQSIHLTLVTDISAGTLLDGATEIGALLAAADAIPNTRIIYLPRIHAKIYTSGTGTAIVTSANLTMAGLRRNLEYGVRLTDPRQVEQVRTDAERYAALGALVSPARLRVLDAYTRELQRSMEEERRSMAEKVRTATQFLYRRTEDELLRARVADRPITRIFAETIVFVLRSGPLRTTGIEARIQEIHPDLCDDTMDRVIDGESFGKLWKHHVRNAQQLLKNQGTIVRDPSTAMWRRADSSTDQLRH